MGEIYGGIFAETYGDICRGNIWGNIGNIRKHKKSQFRSHDKRINSHP